MDPENLLLCFKSHERNLQRYARLAHDTLHSRSLFVTSRGHIGIGLDDISHGDTVGYCTAPAHPSSCGSRTSPAVGDWPATTTFTASWEEKRWGWALVRFDCSSSC